MSQHINSHVHVWTHTQIQFNLKKRGNTSGLPLRTQTRSVKYIKQHSASNVIRKMQLKTTKGYHCVPTRTPLSKQEVFGQDGERSESLWISEWNVMSRCGSLAGLSHGSAVLLLDTHPKTTSTSIPTSMPALSVAIRLRRKATRCIKGRVTKYTHTHIYIQTEYSDKNKFYTMDETWKHYAKWLNKISQIGRSTATPHLHSSERRGCGSLPNGQSVLEHNVVKAVNAT